MSYAIIKSIKIKEGKVFVKYSDNNVYPHIYSDVELPFYTAILQKEGEKELTISIIGHYLEGTNQPGVPNKYSRAAKRLMRMPEYDPFDWRKGGLGKDFTERVKYKREHEQELKELIWKAYNTKDEKSPCIITKLYYNGEKLYARKVTMRSMCWTKERSEAKIWSNEQDARDIFNCFEWHAIEEAKIEKVA